MNSTSFSSENSTTKHVISNIGVLQVNLKRGTFTYNVGRDSSKYTITSVLEKRLDFPSTQTDMEKILSNATQEGSHQRILASVLSKEQVMIVATNTYESLRIIVSDSFIILTIPLPLSRPHPLQGRNLWACMG